MLFDLRGRRRRVIQVVYAFLALAFAITFVGFGIGSDASGGIFDALGLGSGNGSGSAETGFERQIEQAEARLERDPRNAGALSDLARAYALDGKARIESVSETGVPEINEEARQSFELAAAAWEDYLKTDPPNPDPNLAIILVRNVFVNLGDVDGAARAQEVYAEANPSSTTYAELAQYRYLAGEFEAGDEATELALDEASGSAKTTLEDQLAQIEKQARRFVKAQKNVPQGSQPNPVENPFGSLGGSGITP
jgi:tetratricopeptide (TPR) repeat protein